MALKAAIGTCSHDKEAALPSEKFTNVFRYEYRAYIVFRKEEGEVGLCGYGPWFPACRHTHERGNVLGLFVGASLSSALESVLGLLAGSSRPQRNGCSREQGHLASVLTPTEGPRRVQNSKLGAGSNSPAWTPLPQGLVPARTRVLVWGQKMWLVFGCVLGHSSYNQDLYNVFFFILTNNPLLFVGR